MRVSLYPEPRIYGDVAHARPDIWMSRSPPMRPWCCQFATGRYSAGIALALRPAGQQTLTAAVSAARTSAKRVIYETAGKPFGDDYTSLVPASGRTSRDRRGFPVAASPDRHASASCSYCAKGEVGPRSLRGTARGRAGDSPAIVALGRRFLRHRSTASRNSGTFWKPRCQQPAATSHCVSRAKDHQATVSVWLWEDRPGRITTSLPDAAAAAGTTFAGRRLCACP